MTNHRKLKTNKGHNYNNPSSLNNSGSESATTIEDKPQSKAEPTLEEEVKLHKEAIAYILHHMTEQIESLKENTRAINKNSETIHNHINEL